MATPEMYMQDEACHHLLKDILVVYVLEHRDEAGQLVLHLVLRHSLCRFFQQIVTVFCQLRRGDSQNMMSKPCVYRGRVCVCVFVWA